MFDVGTEKSPNEQGKEPLIPVVVSNSFNKLRPIAICVTATEMYVTENW